MPHRAKQYLDDLADDIFDHMEKRPHEREIIDRMTRHYADVHDMVDGHEQRARRDGVPHHDEWPASTGDPVPPAGARRRRR